MGGRRSVTSALQEGLERFPRIMARVRYHQHHPRLMAAMQRAADPALPGWIWREYRTWWVAPDRVRAEMTHNGSAALREGFVQHGQAWRVYTTYSPTDSGDRSERLTPYMSQVGYGTLSAARNADLWAWFDFSWAVPHLEWRRVRDARHRRWGRSVVCDVSPLLIPTTAATDPTWRTSFGRQAWEMSDWFEVGTDFRLWIDLDSGFVWRMTGGQDGHTLWRVEVVERRTDFPTAMVRWPDFIGHPCR